MFKNHSLETITKFYNLFVRSGTIFQSLFLLWMRCTWGHQFILAGMKKLSQTETSIEFFTSLGILHPKIFLYATSYIEVVGGVLLIAGLGSRLISVPLVFVMLSALSKAHFSEINHFQFILDPSSLVQQPPYPYLITSLLVFCFGPGKISFDAWIRRWVNRQPTY
jgi:putative oxidoreductase